MKVTEILSEFGSDPIGALISTLPSTGGIAPEDQNKLDQIMQRLSSMFASPDPKVKKYTPVTNSPNESLLMKAAVASGIKGVELAAFMGQCAHESAKFTATKEIGSGSRYEGRRDLGNVRRGDGERYKGRGFIQLTGRANYTNASKALGVDLVNHPELAEQPNMAAKVSVWFWKTYVKPHVSNFNDTKAVTKKINPALKGLTNREKYTQSFKTAGL